ncbi:MAG: hypothetical protein ACOCWI_00460 [Bacillota bacterium]
MVDNSIKLISNLTDKLMATNLLVLDKDITYFLSQVVDDENLCEIIKECNINYSFYEDWEKAKKLKKIYLPVNKREIVAFVMGLFYKLDTKEISIIELLTEFYPNNSDMHKAYNLFGKEVIVPLKNAFITILQGQPVEEEKSKNQNPVLDKMIEDIDDWLKMLKQNILSGKYSLDEVCSKEIIFFIKGLQNILDTNDTYLIKLVWRGLISATYKYNVKFKELDRIEKLFRLYGINMEI